MTDERILKTADYLRDHSSHGGGFFQNMIHSGINAYLTLHLAQIQLRAGQPETAWKLMENVGDYSPACSKVVRCCSRNHGSSQRSAPTPKSCKPCGYEPVNRIRNHATIVVIPHPRRMKINTM